MHWVYSRVVVMVHSIAVLTMQNQRIAICHPFMTMRKRKIATEPLDAAIPMMQMPWPMASHMMDFE